MTQLTIPIRLSTFFLLSALWCVTGAPSTYPGLNGSSSSQIFFHNTTSGESNNKANISGESGISEVPSLNQKTKHGLKGFQTQPQKFGNKIVPGFPVVFPPKGTTITSTRMKNIAPQTKESLKNNSVSMRRTDLHQHQPNEVRRTGSRVKVLGLGQKSEGKDQESEGSGGGFGDTLNGLKSFKSLTQEPGEVQASTSTLKAIRDELEDSVDARQIITLGSAEYTPREIAEYIFWSGDERGVTMEINGLVNDGLMWSRDDVIDFLEKVESELEFLRHRYEASESQTGSGYGLSSFTKLKTNHSLDSNPMPSLNLKIRNTPNSNPNLAKRGLKNGRTSNVRDELMK